MGFITIHTEFIDIITENKKFLYTEFKNIKPINIHFVGVTKPFVDAEKYCENNINERKENCFSLFFPFYLKYAEEAGCSKDFCARIKKNYERFKKWNLDEDSTHAQTALLYLLKRIIERD